MGNDTEGCIATIAAASIEQVKFLNTFAGIPLEILYENVGQRHKASNLMLLSLLKQCETAGAGDELGLIRINGETGGMYEGLIAEVDGGKMPDVVWSSQNEVIKKQTAWLRTLSGTYAEKLANLPKQPSWWSVLGDTVVDWVTDNVIESLVGKLIGEVVEETEEIAKKRLILMQVFTFLWEYGTNAWEYVKKYYNDTCKICDTMADENDALLKMTNTLEHYDLRTRTLQQHDNAAKNIIELITGLEKQMENVVPTTDSYLPIVEALQALSYQDQEVDFGGVRVALRSKLLTTAE